MNNVKVSCSQGHRFPVNLLKHTNRAYVFCPKCREKVVIRKKHIFSPNPEWSKKKERRKEARIERRRRRKVGETIDGPMPMFSKTVPLGLLSLSKLIKERKKEAERESEA